MSTADSLEPREGFAGPGVDSVKPGKAPEVATIDPGDPQGGVDPGGPNWPDPFGATTAPM
jgi:hypothetical protein